MLLPSALPCDTRARPTLQRAPAYTISSPPLSPPASHFSANIFSTCRALQSLLGSQPPPIRRPNLPSSTSKPRVPHTKIEKRKPTVPRGMNKRRRDILDTGAHSSINDQENLHRKNGDGDGYSTPKRQRLAPPSIPLGLERRDFYALQPNYNFTTANPYTSTTAIAMQPSPPLSEDDSSNNTSHNTTDDTDSQWTSEDDSSNNTSHNTTDDTDSQWTSEDDSQLVDLVLDKLRLSKRDWEECARVLGTDSGSLGKRWKELVGEGGVGLRFRRGGRARGDIRGVWRE